MFIIFGRTDLRKGVSRAKFDAESDFEVQLAVAPPKSTKNDKKLISEIEKIRVEIQVFRYFALDFEELQTNGPHHLLPRQILL